MKLWPFKSKPKFLALNEYWVYLPEPKLPLQDDLMTWALQENPYGPIRAKEGILFSDVRLCINLVLKSKNPHVFRPDVTMESGEIEAAMLTELAECPAMALIRYSSDEPLFSDAHLRLLPYLVCGVSHFTGAKLCADRVKQSLFWIKELGAEIKKDPEVKAHDIHVGVSWKNSEGGGGVAQTHGLAKIGLPEIQTEPADLDRRVILMNVIESAVQKVWEDGSIPESMEVECFGDAYSLALRASKELMLAAVTRLP